MAGSGDGVVVIAASTGCERAIKVTANGSAVARDAKAMVVGALDADDAVNGEETGLKLSDIFVANTLYGSTSLITRMNGSKVRLQERDEILRDCGACSLEPMVRRCGHCGTASLRSNGLIGKNGGAVFRTCWSNQGT